MDKYTTEELRRTVRLYNFAAVTNPQVALLYTIFML